MPASDLVTRTAQFFLLAEQASRLTWWIHPTFWKLFAASTTEIEAAAHLPALTAAVRTYADSDLQLFARFPLPDVLPPEAVPWYARLGAAWKWKRIAEDRLGPRALVRLDGCGMPTGMERLSRLAEWLQKAQETTRRMENEKGKRKKKAWKTVALRDLAALAAWRPAPGVRTPPETLREWVAFWQEKCRGRNPLMKGIAALALLNLPETDRPTAPTEALLHDLTAALSQVMEKDSQDDEVTYLFLSVLDWQPAPGVVWPAAEVREAAAAWRKLTFHPSWWYRQLGWRQLIPLDRTGILAQCGVDLLPQLVNALATEQNEWVLWEMAQWTPTRHAPHATHAAHRTPTEEPDRRDLLQRWEAQWQRRRASATWKARASAWLAGVRLHQAGWATESPESFHQAYLAAVEQENNANLLFVLTQWSPGAAAPAAWRREWRTTWLQRLGEADPSLQHVAAFALLRQAVERESWVHLRRAVSAGWGRDSPATLALETAIARLYEVQSQLAAGESPNFVLKPAPLMQWYFPSQWKIEHGKWKIENGKWNAEHAPVNQGREGCGPAPSPTVNAPPQPHPRREGWSR